MPGYLKKLSTHSLKYSSGLILSRASKLCFKRRGVAGEVSIYRVIDANYNRAKEGLRVCEEITRFILDNRKLTSEFKKIRHGIDSIVRKTGFNLTDLLSERCSTSDVGRKIYLNELNRKNIWDVFFANIQRVKESIRVLEEFTKLINKKSAVKFKGIRYDIYNLEKKVSGKLSSSINPPSK